MSGKQTLFVINYLFCSSFMESDVSLWFWVFVVAKMPELSKEQQGIGFPWSTL